MLAFHHEIGNKKDAKTYHNLDLAYLLHEHQQRIIQTKLITKKYLRTSLNMEMYKTEQLPALFFNTPFVSPHHINLSKNILINEPAHDISNHIKTFRKNCHIMFPKKAKYM